MVVKNKSNCATIARTNFSRHSLFDNSNCHFSVSSSLDVSNITMILTLTNLTHLIIVYNRFMRMINQKETCRQNPLSCEIKNMDDVPKKLFAMTHALV